MRSEAGRPTTQAIEPIGTETMKLHRFFKATTVGLLVTSIVLQAPLARAEAPQAPKSPTRPVSAVLDVELATDGALTGEVFNMKGEPVKNAVISVRLGRNEVAQARSNEDGTFKVKDLKPGVYHVVAGTGQGLYRVWSTKAAPPKAMAKVKIVSDRTVIRAQNANPNDSTDGRILYDQNGTAYGQVRIVDEGGLVPVGVGTPVGVAGGGSFLSSLGLFDAAVLGVGIAGVTVGAIAIDRANEAKDKVDRIAASP